jgi:hypothetical protein
VCRCSEEPAVSIMFPDDTGSRFLGNSGKYLTASNGSPLPMFRDNVLVPC